LIDCKKGNLISYLNRFNADSTDVRIILELSSQRFYVVVFKQLKTGCEGSEVSVPGRIVTSTRRGDSSAPEIACWEENVSLVAWNFFNAITPAAGQLAGCLVSLDAAVAWQHLFKACYLGKQLTELAHLGIHHSPRCYCNFGRLFNKSFQNFRVNMTLVCSPVARNKVEVTFTFNIP
jgi:hypothetical protein